MKRQITAATFIAIAIAMAAIVDVIAPWAVAPEVSAATTAPEGNPFVYFPAQYVNQATGIEPAPPTF